MHDSLVFSNAVIIYEYSSHECKQSKRHHHDSRMMSRTIIFNLLHTKLSYSPVHVNLQSQNSICSYLTFFVFWFWQSDMLCYSRDPGGAIAMQQHVCRVFPQGRGDVEALTWCARWKRIFVHMSCSTHVGRFEYTCHSSFSLKPPLAFRSFIEAIEAIETSRNGGRGTLDVGSGCCGHEDTRPHKPVGCGSEAHRSPKQYDLPGDESAKSWWYERRPGPIAWLWCHVLPWLPQVCEGQWWRQAWGCRADRKAWRCLQEGHLWWYELCLDKGLASCSANESRFTGSSQPVV